MTEPLFLSPLCFSRKLKKGAVLGSRATSGRMRPSAAAEMVVNHEEEKSTSCVPELREVIAAGDLRSL